MSGFLFQNYYKGLHGGAVAAITERLATACTRTIVSEEKPLFLGEMSISYLSAVPMNVSHKYTTRSKLGIYNAVMDK